MKLLLFGRLGERAALPPVPAGIGDTDRLRAWLAEVDPGLLDGSVRIAVNRELVHANVPLAAEDEIALLPPMSGG